MACTVRVLMNVATNEIEQYYKDFDEFKRSLEDISERENVAKELISRLQYDLPENYHEAVDYVKDYIPNVKPDSDALVFGIERPEYIKDLVKNWNLRNSENCINAFKSLEDIASKDKKTLSQFLTSKIIPEQGNIEWFTGRMSMYDLRKALDAVDGVFSYGSPSDLADFSYLDTKENRYFCSGTTLEEDAIDYVSAHPGEFVLIECCYD